MRKKKLRKRKQRERRNDVIEKMKIKRMEFEELVEINNVDGGKSACIVMEYRPAMLHFEQIQAEHYFILPNDAALIPVIKAKIKEICKRIKTRCMAPFPPKVVVAMAIAMVDLYRPLYKIAKMCDVTDFSLRNSGKRFGAVYPERRYKDFGYQNEFIEFIKSKIQPFGGIMLNEYYHSFLGFEYWWKCSIGNHCFQESWPKVARRIKEHDKFCPTCVAAAVGGDEIDGMGKSDKNDKNIHNQQ